MSDTKRIEIDIGEALRVLQASPELAQALNEAALGKVAADTIAQLESDLAAARARLARYETALRLIADGHYISATVARATLSPAPETKP